MLNGVIYARYSKGPNQTDQSIEGQVLDCRRYAEANDIEIINIYADRHISGKSTDGREELHKMIADAEAGKFTDLLCWKTDRLGRDKYDLAVIKRQLKQYGVKIHYVMEHIPDTPEGIILEALMEGLAEYYSADLSQKIKRGHRSAALKGEYVSNVPLGYTKVEKKVVIDEDVAPFIVDAFEMKARGERDVDILDYLNDNGVQSRKHKKIVKSVLARMFVNRKYLGEFEVQGIKIPVEPIISTDLFDRVQKRVESSERGLAGRGKHLYLLGGKCYCKACGRLIRGESARSHTGDYHFYYMCPNKCHSMRFKEADLDSEIFAHTINDVLTDEMLEKMCDAILEYQDKEDNSLQLKRLESKKDGLKKKLNSVLDAIEENYRPALVERLDTIQAELDSVEAQIAEIEIQRPIFSKEIIMGFLKKLQVGDKGDTQYYHTLAKTFIHHVDVSPNEITLYYNLIGSSIGPQVNQTEQYTNPYFNGQFIVFYFQQKRTTK